MKTQMIKKAFVSIALILAVSLTVPKAVEAKMFGTTVLSTTDWADGVTAWRTTCTQTQIFWIVVSTDCTTVAIVSLAQ
jgi:hypothetical protein